MNIILTSNWLFLLNLKYIYIYIKSIKSNFYYFFFSFNMNNQIKYMDSISKLLFPILYINK